MWGVGFRVQGVRLRFKFSALGLAFLGTAGA